MNLMPRRMTISDRGVRTMLRITASPDDVASGPDEPLPWSVLHGLRDLVRCDGMTFFQLDSTRQVVSMAQDLSDDDHSPDQLAELELGFWAHYPHSRPCNYPDRSGDLTSVTTFSDFLSQRQMRSSGMYSDYLRHFGAEREMLLCLPSPRYRTLRLLLYRGRGPDFSDRDRALLTLLRPHLYATYVAGTRTESPNLTARQFELLRLVADGHTNRQIARRLMVADSTVRKHMENIFERLQVSNRAAAVARVFGAQPAE